VSAAAEFFNDELPTVNRTFCTALNAFFTIVTTIDVKNVQIKIKNVKKRKNVTKIIKKLL